MVEERIEWIGRRRRGRIYFQYAEGSKALRGEVRNIEVKVQRGGGEHIRWGLQNIYVLSEDR